MDMVHRNVDSCYRFLYYKIEYRLLLEIKCIQCMLHLLTYDNVYFCYGNSLVMDRKIDTLLLSDCFMHFTCHGRSGH